MMKTQGQSDPLVTVLALVATVVGLLAVWDSGYARAAVNGQLVPRELQSQIVFSLVSVVVGVLVSRMRPSRMRKAAWVGLFLVVVGMVLVELPGVGKEINGARRWIDFRLFTVQPAEFAKLAVIVFLAALLAAWKPVKAKAVKHWGEAVDRIWMPRLAKAFPALLVVVTILMVERERDLGTMMVVVAAGFGTLFVAGADKRLLACLAAAALVTGGAFIFKESYRSDRIANHIHRWNDDNVDGPGYQTTQSETALAQGGLLGVGLGNGRAKHVLPAPTTDFVLATVGEEFGLVGSLAVIGLLAAVTWRLMVRALASQDVFARGVLGGVAAWIAFQTTVNVLMVNGAFPPVGVPLPFVSAGGSSLVALWAAVGLCQAVLCGEKVVVKEEEDASGRDGWRHGRPRVSRA
ncbi:MAG: FtsW/RodA/SpoVE family cell cycle protein [Armatimonadetes bacterium]|nr:FtsW/RodA/SpoVE family cell cycle protein [Armatimonadota bacterium]